MRSSHPLLLRPSAPVVVHRRFEAVAGAGKVGRHMAVRRIVVVHTLPGTPAVAVGGNIRPGREEDPEEDSRAAAGRRCSSLGWT